MTSSTSTIIAGLAALLVGVAAAPGYAADEAAAPAKDKSGKPTAGFKDCDTNKDGFLSLEEFEAKGLDNLAFKAADINGDNRVDPDEYATYRKAKATDPRSESGAPGQPPAAMEGEPATPAEQPAQPSRQPGGAPQPPAGY